MDDHITTIYDTDFLDWTSTQIELLRTKQFERLDLENIIEELKSMALAQRHELEHRIERLTTHLLKCKVQPWRISGSWLGTIREQRYRIARLLEAMPSLQPLLDQYVITAYAHAAARAADETRLPRAAFPATVPFTKEQLLDPDYLP
jgi:hypothetical protein